uniref:Uncharacterized protein n=1 Tax=Arundo donax TaxID=35708 RepID=A0A0A8YIT7_ARUDO
MLCFLGRTEEAKLVEWTAVGWVGC